MPIKYIVSIFAAALIGYSISPSYSQDGIFCDGFECAAGDPVLEERIAALEALLADVTRGTDPNTGQDTLTFSAMNVQVVSGSGTTDGPVNGTGNLIIGYNESRGDSDCPDGHLCDRRFGSHMLVSGSQINYRSYGGIVVGLTNAAQSPYASISGGRNNGAGGVAASVSGGEWQNADGEISSVSGGRNNTASGHGSSVSGGTGNNASGPEASVSGGAENAAIGTRASILGGLNNDASGTYGSVSGGNEKYADSDYCTTAGEIGTDCVP
ncbi:hypothetical protein ACFL1V_01455 [Pseudomonadota bacterium]